MRGDTASSVLDQRYYDEMTRHPVGRRPAVSVILPAFNPGSYLKASVESVLVECSEDVELIVVDDGGTDGSVDALRAHPRLRVIRQSNTGLAGALRAGIAASSGPLIARMDHDDVNVRGRIARARDLLERHPDVAVVSCWAEVIDEDGQLVGKLAWPWLKDDVMRDLRYVMNNMVHGAAVFRRATYDQVGGYRDVPAEDYDLWLRMTQKADAAIIPEFLYRYRRSPGSMTGREGSRHDASFRALSREQWMRRGAPSLPPPFQCRRRYAYYRSHPTSGSAADTYVRSLLALSSMARQRGHAALSAHATLAAVACAPVEVALGFSRRMRRAVWPVRASATASAERR